MPETDGTPSFMSCDCQREIICVRTGPHSAIRSVSASAVRVNVAAAFPGWARHKSPRTAMRYVKPGDAAVAEVTTLLGPARRSH